MEECTDAAIDNFDISECFIRNAHKNPRRSQMFRQVGGILQELVAALLGIYLACVLLAVLVFHLLKHSLSLVRHYL